MPEPSESSPRPRTLLREELGRLVRLALPIAAAGAGQALMGLVDTAVVGRVGAGPLGAVGLANGMFFTVSMIGWGVVMGMDPLISQALGAGDARRASGLLWQGAWLALIVSAVLAVPLAFLPAILVPFGVAPPIARDATLYLWLRIPSLPLMLLYGACRAYLQAVHRPAGLLVAVVAANAVNFLLDLVFVFGAGPIPALGAAGSAIASSLCTVVQLAIIAWAVSRAPGERAATRRPDGDALRRAIRVGTPVGLQLGAETGVFALVGLLAGRLGAVSLAAHQVAITLASFSFTFAVGIGSAGSVQVGRAVGAGDAARTRIAGLASFGLGAAVMSCSGLAFWLAPGPIAGLLSNQADVVAASAPVLAVAALFQISDGIQGVGAGVLRGAGDTRYPFFANLLGHWLVGLPIAVGLGILAHEGVVGLWWGLAAGLTAVALALFTRFWRLSAQPIVPLEAPPMI